MHSSNNHDRIFNLSFSSKTKIGKKLIADVESVVEKLTDLHKLELMYDYVKDKYDPNLPFCDQALNTLNINYSLSESDLARIPKEGPLVVVANHPFGGIEGIIMGSLLQSIRPDVKIMANYLLGRIPELRDLFILVDPFEKSESKYKNLKPLKESLQWLKQEHLLGIFPAGEVSHLQLSKRAIMDKEWSPTIGRIIRNTKSPVLPIFFKGTNSKLFQILGLIHPTLRTLLLAHEMVKKMGTKIDVKIGQIIPYKKLSEYETDKELVSYLKLRTYNLGYRDKELKKAFKIPFFKKKREEVKTENQEFEEIIPAIDRDILINELAKLDPKQKLLKHGDWTIYAAKAEEIPNMIREIGRLREVTFRASSEGTGKSLDLDPFDDYYHHLFIWDDVNVRLVGAYRLGLSEDILDKFGKSGFYSATLFKYKMNFIEKIRPAIELGRSFICKEYQRNFSSLLTLWKGIGRFILLHPDYKLLFGPVSISNEYGSISQELMVAYLKEKCYIPNLARLVKAKTPLKPKSIKQDTVNPVKDIDEVSHMISDIEEDQKGVPILLKQYLKLGGKLLGFNIDPDFSDVLDGLILVDLTKTDPKLLERYMGKEGAESFFEHHKNLIKNHSVA